VVLGRGQTISPRDLPQKIRNYHPALEAGPLVPANLTVEEAEKQLIIRALQDCKGNRTEAARKLGISRRTLHRKLHEYHLEGF